MTGMQYQSPRESARHDIGVQAPGHLPKMVELSLDQLVAHPDQPRQRFEELSLRDLALSIKLHGMLQPITVQERPEGEGYWVVAGERRRRAVRLLGRLTIPAIVTNGNPDELALIENIQREDLHPLEEADAMAGLMARHGYTQEELARIVGKARPTVTKLLKLTNLPNSIKEECATLHTISRSVLLEIAHVDDPDEQLWLWERAKAGATVQTVRETRAAIRGGKRPARDTLDDLLASGRTFLKRLQRAVQAERIPQTHDLQELLALRKEIEALIETCLGRVNGAMPPAETRAPVSRLHEQNVGM